MTAETIERVLARGTWAVVGLTANPRRPAYGVARFLQQQGKKIVPVNPKAEPVHGEQGYATLADVPFPVDVVDVFRRSAEAGAHVDEAVAAGAKAVWLQLGRDRRGRGGPGRGGRPGRGHGPLPGDRVVAHGRADPAPRWTGSPLRRSGVARCRSTGLSIGRLTSRAQASGGRRSGSGPAAGPPAPPAVAQTSYGPASSAIQRRAGADPDQLVLVREQSCSAIRPDSSPRTG